MCGVRPASTSSIIKSGRAEEILSRAPDTEESRREQTGADGSRRREQTGDCGIVRRDGAAHGEAAACTVHTPPARGRNCVTHVTQLRIPPAPPRPAPGRRETVPPAARRRSCRGVAAGGGELICSSESSERGGMCGSSSPAILGESYLNTVSPRPAPLPALYLDI